MKRGLLALFPALYFLNTSCVEANVNFNIRNLTDRPIEITFLVHKSGYRTQRVQIIKSGYVSYDDLIQNCKPEHICEADVYRVVVQRWGLNMVFVQCPKVINPSGENVTYNIRVSGNDTSALYCDFSEGRTKHKRKSHDVSINDEDEEHTAHWTDGTTAKPPLAPKTESSDQQKNTQNESSAPPTHTMEHTQEESPPSNQSETNLSSQKENISTQTNDDNRDE